MNKIKQINWKNIFNIFFFFFLSWKKGRKESSDVVA